jgi:Uma2 family endonuclease
MVTSRHEYYISPEEYFVLISQDTMIVECFRRNQEGRWELFSFEKDEEVHLASVDFRCPIVAIYEDVTLAGEPS